MAQATTSSNPAPPPLRDDQWRIPDVLSDRIEPRLPPRPVHPLGCHDPRVADRKAMDALFFVLRSGCRWGALDSTGLCPHSSAHRRFQERAAAGVFLNRHDRNLVEATLESILAERPKPTAKNPKECLDKGYDYVDTRKLVRYFGFTAHVRARGEEAGALKREAGEGQSLGGGADTPLEESFPSVADPLGEEGGCVSHGDGLRAGIRPDRVSGVSRLDR